MDNSNAQLININIYFPESLRDDYIKFYESILKKYNDTNELVHSNLKDKFQEYREEEYGKLFKIYSDPSDMPDPGELASIRIEMDFLMKYQYHFMSLVNLYHVFEQQIRKLLYEELNHSTSNVETKEKYDKFATTFRDVKKVLKKIKYSVGSNPQWPAIDELNKIANTYKHGDGPSAQALYKFNKNIFTNESNRYIYFSNYEEKSKNNIVSSNGNSGLTINKELTTISEIVLREDTTPFKKYINAIIKFWNEFPKYHSVIIELDEVEVENDCNCSCHKAN